MKYKNNTSNILALLLEILGVKYTHAYADRLYNEHPNKYNLLGISKMISSYNIDNVAIKVSDKEHDINLMQFPFVAYIGSDFVVVFKRSNDNIFYMWYGHEMSISLENFVNIWSGIALIVESNNNSIEPDYKKHFRYDLIKLIQNILLILFSFMIILFLFIKEGVFIHISNVIIVIINFIGIFISTLLLKKHLSIHSPYADKICSLFKHKDCNSILDTPESKLFGIWSWAEIGLSYFVSNLISLFLPSSITSYVVLINILALPFTFWSIWFQKYKVKKWCLLCLIVQICLWLLLLVNLFTNSVNIVILSFDNIFLIVCIYTIPFLLINLLIHQLGISNRHVDLIQNLNSIKAVDEVFYALLKQQKYSYVDKNSSSILFGNSNANDLITIVTNPHCSPCAKMHNKFDNLLNVLGDKVCFQYIFTSFNAGFESSALFLIAAYLNNKDSNTVRDIYKNWFDNMLNNMELCFDVYDYLLNDNRIVQEYLSHKEWCEISKYKTTPTILINGYKLPDYYRIEDLSYIFDH